MFARVSDAMADETLRVARTWQPDLVVYAHIQGAGLLRPAPWAYRRSSTVSTSSGRTASRRGTSPSSPRPALGSGYRSNCPRSRCCTGAAAFLASKAPALQSCGTSRTTRAERPAGLAMALRQRPRVVVTLGTVMPGVAGLGSVAPLLAAAAEVDADFLLAFGDGADTDALGPLPANARPIGWVPLYPLLARCAAIVHHGGSNTTLTALAAGVPQLVLPHAGGQFLHAGLVATHGLGMRREPGDVDPDTLTELLRDGPFRIAARAGADQVRAQPTPAALVPQIEALAGRAQATASVPVPTHR